MRIYYSARDSLLLEEYLLDLPGIEIVTLPDGAKEAARLVPSLIREKVDVVVQVAPQWEWGKYMEEISVEIMRHGIKLVCGEGTMFRWTGKPFRMGSDAGFYLAPWGYSGNSKIAYQLPTPLEEDIIVTEQLRNDVPRWCPGPRKILVAGQQDWDRSKYFRGPTKSNEEFIEKCISIWGADRLVFREHPEFEKTTTCRIAVEDSGQPLKDILCSYAACVSANSTATIEAMCAGMPTMNDGLGPWSGAKVVQKLDFNVREFSYDEYLMPLAALVHLHRLLAFKHGDPLFRALEFYSEYDPAAFTFNCRRFNDKPIPWQGTYVW